MSLEIKVVRPLLGINGKRLRNARLLRGNLSKAMRGFAVRFVPRMASWIVDGGRIFGLPGFCFFAQLILRKWIEAIEPDFDRDHYLGAIYPESVRARASRNPVLHYCMSGWMRDLSPHAEFDPRSYRGGARDLHWAADPFRHYLAEAGPRAVGAPASAPARPAHHPISVDGTDARRRETEPCADEGVSPDPVRARARDIRLSEAADCDAVTVTVGICVHNGPEYVRRCLAALPAALGPSMRVVLVDDGSDAETASILDGFVANVDRASLIRHDRPIGYTRSANKILAASKDDWIILLNSDTEVAPRALRKLVETGERYPTLGVVGPLSNAAGWQSVPSLTSAEGGFMINAIPPGLSVADMDQICDRVSGGRPLFVPLVNGFCMALRRSALDVVGCFDEENFPIAYGEEDDLCLRMIDHGFACAIAQNSYVFHVKSASYTSDRRKLLTAAGRKALHEKHGVDGLHAAVTTMKFHSGLRRIRKQIELAQQRKPAGIDPLSRKTDTAWSAVWSGSVPSTDLAPQPADRGNPAKRRKRAAHIPPQTPAHHDSRWFIQ